MVGLAGAAVAVCSAGEEVGDSDGCWMSISLKLGTGAGWRVGSVSCCDGSPVPSSPLFLVLTLRADLPSSFVPGGISTWPPPHFVPWLTGISGGRGVLR